MASGYSPASTGVDGTSTAYSYPSQYSDGQQHQQHQQQQYNSGLMATSDYQQSGLMATTDYPDATTAAKAEAIQDHHQHHAHAHAHAGYPQESHAAPPATPVSKEGRICGMRKTTFWLVVLSAILAAGLIGAAAAAGILASQNSDSSGSTGSGAATTPSAPEASTSAAASASASESSSATRTASATDFTAIPIPSQAASGLGVPDPGCPDVNGTDYTVPGTDLVFERLCGVNFAGNDIGHLPMTRMEDCLALCASQYVSPQGAAGSCLGVVWGYGGRQGTNSAYCWLKFGKTIREDVADTETAWLKPR